LAYNIEKQPNKLKLLEKLILNKREPIAAAK
jgi:hypothetical protein